MKKIIVILILIAGFLYFQNKCEAAFYDSFLVGSDGVFCVDGVSWQDNDMYNIKSIYDLEEDYYPLPTPTPQPSWNDS